MRKLLFFLCALLTGVGTMWADGPDVSGKTFTLTCARGSISGNGSQLVGGNETSEFAIVEWDDEVSGGTFLYDVTNKAFVIHSEEANAVNGNNNSCLESSTDFSMIIKGLQWQETSTSNSWHLTDENNFYLNMSGSAVRMNTWRTSDDGNCYTVAVVNESFDSSEAITMLENYFDSKYEDMLSELIEEAEEIVKCSGTPGYPTASAMSILESAINEANSASEKKSAYKSLKEAIATAWTDINYIPQTGKYYTIVNARGAMVYDPTHDESVDATNNDANYLWYNNGTLDTTDPNNLWGFVAKDGNYYMYNAGKKQFATVGKGTYGGTWIFSNTPAYITLDDGIADEIAAPNVRVRATIATTGESYTMSVSTSYTGPVITYDGVNDGGVPMLFTEIKAADADVVSAIEALLEDVTPFREALQAVIDGTETIQFGTGLGKYTANEDYTSALAAAEAAVANTQATKDELISARTALEEAIAGLTLNLPQTGTFLHITGKTSGKHLAAGSASNGKFNMSDATDATTIFYYDDEKHLVNLGSGLANGMTATSWDWVYGVDNASTVTFGDGGTNGGYNILSTSAYFYDDGNNGSANRGQQNDGDVRYNSWELEEITTLPITLNDIEYATLCSPVALTILPSESVTAYVATGLNGSSITLEAISGTIPADVPVILKGTADKTYNFGITTGGSTPGTDNILTATGLGVASIDAESVYTLQNIDGPAFYTYTGTQLPAFKAYLPKTAGSNNVKGFTFDFGTTDGIATVEGAVAEGSVIYNLAGQRVEKAVKGVYIVNGKKVLVK